MHIGLFTGNFPPMICGIGDYTVLLANALVERGHRVSILTSSGRTPAELPGVRVFPVMDTWMASEIPKVVSILQAEGIELAHLQYQAAAMRYGDFPWRWAKEAREKCPTVTTLHDYAGSWGRLGMLAVLEQMRNARAVIVTHDKPHRVVRQLPFVGKKVAKIGVGATVPVYVLKPGEELPKRTADEIVLAYVGFVWRGKNIEQLFRVVSVLAQRGQRARLVCLGQIKEPAYHQELQALADSLGVARQVGFTGATDAATLSKWLQISDVCVLPYSHGATMAHTTLLVGMDHGLPVVTTAGQDKQLVNGENVLYVPLADTSAWVDGIERVVGDNAMRERLSAGGRALAAQFSWERIAEQHEGVYESILK